MTNKIIYLSYILSAYDRDSVLLETELDKWRQAFDPHNALFGYSNPKFPLQLAVAASFLYQQTGKIEYAWKARDALLGMRELTRLMPPETASQRPEYEDGIPPMDCVFDPLIVAPACERIQAALTEQEYQELGSLIADSLHQLWRFPEWGGHNRAMLRAASLAASAHAFPQRPEAADWIILADELAEESWGRWSIEDAMLYQVHWLRALILYAEARGKTDELEQFIQPHLYLRSMAQMIMPIGILPDYGDSHWMMHSQFEWMACLEWGARVYRDPTLKWAAQRIWEVQKAAPPVLYHALSALQAYLWMDESIVAQPPSHILEALDDLVSKKLVFRSGWDDSAAYACINYRDEGSYGLVARDYLRTTLAVSAEKMHHGHSDEGSFSALCYKGSLLLHESGYRESPPDGIYRADIYHNRLVWRQGMRLTPGLLEFLRDNGHYRPAVTERLYQTSLGAGSGAPRVEISRIRTTDSVRGVQWDRSIFFMPDMPCWVVIDSALSLRTENRTFASLWWTTDILKESYEQDSSGWSDTYLHGIQNWRNREDAALLIVQPSLPGQANRFFVETARRSFQEEILLASAWSGEHRQGRPVNFVTVLIPHERKDFDTARCAAAIKVIPTIQPDLRLFETNASGQSSAPPREIYPNGRGIAVQITRQDETIFLGALNDLTCGYSQEDNRPRYNAEQGQTTYPLFDSGSAYTTDAAFLCTRQKGKRLWTGFINGTRLLVNNRTLYQGQLHGMFQEDRTARNGIPARFRWEGETDI